MNKFVELIDRQKAGRKPGVEVREGGHTIGEFIRAVMKVDNEADARSFYSGYLEYVRNAKPDPGDPPCKLTPEQIVKSNIGWCFGEGMPDTKIAMWVKVCGASHPVFGACIPSQEEALDKGKELGKKIGRGMGIKTTEE